MARGTEDPADHATWPALRAYYLEDSHVLGIHVLGERVVMDLDLVLTPAHPGYRPPGPAEQHCYRHGQLVFGSLRGFEVEGPQLIRPSIDATGERDLGSIDSLTLSDGRYLVEGGWRVLAIESDPPLVTLGEDDR
jgi:hypothetical protein